MLNSNLNIAILEYDIKWGDKNANLNIVIDAFNKIPHGTDVVILPEMFSTGFITDSYEKAAELAERNTQGTIAALNKIEASHHVTITGSFLASTASQLYNRAFFIEPNVDETFYDKHHLFRMGGEREIYNPGVTLPPTIRFRGWNIKIIVCYDLRFPVWCRNKYDKNESYDLLITIANWPKVRVHPWHTLLAARAIENECYVCGANRSGIDPNGIDYASSSVIYDYKGIECQTQEIKIPLGKIITHSLNRDALCQFKEKFPAWKDADNFTVSI